MKILKSHITDIEHLSKTRKTYNNELSFAGRGLKLNKKEDVKELSDLILKANNLKVLRLEGNTIAPEAAEELAHALEKKKIERFIANDLFTGRLKDEIPLALRSMCGALDRSGTHLVELNMSDNAFGPIGLEALMEFFQSGCCHSLQELRLHNNGLGPQGAQKLALSLENGWVKSGKKLALKVFVCGRNRLEYEGAKSVSNTLKQIGTLEEIQMPQNGIRPNAIEFIAEACAHNPNLKTINLNDNTLRSIGSEWMAKALSKLQKLEYINFGDCLLKSRGALILTRALVQSPNIKEIILSFNEISLESGLEISGLLAHHMKKLELFDLNGNKFGEDGKSDILKILEPMGSAVSSLSEDEGTDDEEEEESDGLAEEDSGDEEENSEVVVDGEEEYDDLEDYEEYDDEEEYDEEGEYEEEEDEDESYEEEQFGNANIVQESTLFKPFNNNNNNNNANNIQNNIQNNKSNLFTTMVTNRYLKTNSIPSFDNFISNPNMESLDAIDQNMFKNVSELQQCDGKFLMLFVNVLSRIYDTASKRLVLNKVQFLFEPFFKNIKNCEHFLNDFLTQFGFIKSEEKSFHPIALNEQITILLADIFKENLVPQNEKAKILNYIQLRKNSMNDLPVNQKFINDSKFLMKCLS